MTKKQKPKVRDWSRSSKGLNPAVEEAKRAKKAAAAERAREAREKRP